MYFPWWTAVLIALLVELILGKKDSTSFFSGFYGVAIPWMILATYIDIKSEAILTVRILELFKLPEYSVVMIVLTGLLGGLAAGVGSMTGGWLKFAFSHENG
jgi:hypothetical protein